MKRKIEILTAAAVLCLAGGMISPGAEPGQEVVEIRSVEDFFRFSENCRSNVWSENVTAELLEDLDFAGHEDMNGIAYFNGTFNGNSHRIDHYSSRNPLFQTVGETGTVRNLFVTAEVKASRDKTAAFVSENGGTLEQITVTGTVTGKETAGILAAVNTETGKILSCEAAGTLTGESSAGGIAGENRGLIDSCLNRADINTSVSDSNLSVDDIRDVLENILITKSINNTENLRMRIDTGGIAGFNRAGAVISGCTNEGTVGYPHYGFNTGGIAGRTGGVIENSRNRGEVYGRRDVGGIAGQQQPEITLDFSEDVLSAMSDEMDGINALITDTLNTSENISNATYDRLSGLSRSMTEVKNNTKVVYDASLDRFDEVSDRVNDTSADLADTAEEMSGAAEDLAGDLRGVYRLTDDVEASIDSLTEAFSLSGEERARILSLNSQVREDLNTTIPFVEEVRENRLPELPEERSARISQGLDGINRLAGDVKALKTLLSGLRSTRDRIADGSLSTEANRRDAALGSSVGSILDSLEELDGLTGSLRTFTRSLGGSLSDVSDGAEFRIRANPAVREAGSSIYSGRTAFPVSWIPSMRGPGRTAWR